jgi:hypothetical protein
MTTTRVRSRPLTLVFAGLGLMLGFSTRSVDAHFPTVQGTTSVSPNSGAPGSTVKATAAAAQPGSPYSLMFADPSQVSSFEQGGGGAGHKEACAHGSPIAGPFTSDASGNIGTVEAMIPPSSPGRALICFENANSLTAPVEFTVRGSMGMQPQPSGR